MPLAHLLLVVDAAGSGGGGRVVVGWRCHCCGLLWLLWYSPIAPASAPAAAAVRVVCIVHGVSAVRGVTAVVAIVIAVAAVVGAGVCLRTEFCSAVVAVKAVLRIWFETPIPGDVCSDPVLLGRESLASRKVKVRRARLMTLFALPSVNSILNYMAYI